MSTSFFSHFSRCLCRSPIRATSVLPKATALNHRSFHLSCTRFQPAALQDPLRPNLFYHLLTPPQTPEAYFALSFLPSPPPNPQSRTIIGFLPAVNADEAAAPQSDETAGKEEEGLGLNDFIENRPFVQVVHDVVKGSVAEDPWWAAEAISRREGYMPIHDARNPPMPNRTPEPEDTLGMVVVQEGKILPETYEPMPTYRICTPDGVLTLTEELERRLIARLEQIQEEELRAGGEAGEGTAAAA